MWVHSWLECHSGVPVHKLDRENCSTFPSYSIGKKKTFAEDQGNKYKSAKHIWQNNDLKMNIYIYILGYSLQVLIKARISIGATYEVSELLAELSIFLEKQRGISKRNTCYENMDHNDINQIRCNHTPFGFGTCYCIYKAHVVTKHIIYKMQ